MYTISESEANSESEVKGEVVARAAALFGADPELVSVSAGASSLDSAYCDQAVCALKVGDEWVSLILSFLDLNALVVYRQVQ